MNILITGGAGFLGSHLADALLSDGHNVFVIDNYSTARRDNLKPHKNLKIVEGSIVDAKLLNNCFSEFRPEIVIHAAASYKNPNNWYEDVSTNVLGTVNVVTAAKSVSVKRIIYFQTSLCYGLHPLEQPITLEHPYFSGKYAGGSSYAISKTGGEQYIELSGIDFIAFRLANAYGPRNISGPLPTFFQRLTTNKACFVMNTRRDFIFVSDLVNVVMKACKGLGTRGYYHISSGKDYSIKQLYDGVVKALGIIGLQDVEVRERSEDDVYTILLNPSKTNADFNWRVEMPLEEGIKLAVDYYRKYGIEQTFTHLKQKD